MQIIIDSLTSNPVYLAVAVVLAVIILIGVIKKFLKLALILLAVLVLYVAYMYWSGEKVDVDSLKKGIQSASETLNEKASDLSKEVRKKVEKSLNP